MLKSIGVIGLIFLMSLSGAHASATSDDKPWSETSSASEEMARLLSELRDLQGGVENQLRWYDQALQSILIQAQVSPPIPTKLKTLLKRENDLLQSGLTSDEIAEGKTRAPCVDFTVADHHLQTSAELLGHILQMLRDPTLDPSQGRVLAYTAKQILVHSYLTAGMMDLKLDANTSLASMYLNASTMSLMSLVIQQAIDGTHHLIATGLGGLAITLGVASWGATRAQTTNKPRLWTHPDHFARRKAVSNKLIERFWNSIPGRSASPQLRLNEVMKTLSLHVASNEHIDHCEALLVTNLELESKLKSARAAL